METIKLYAFAGVLVTAGECYEYPAESGATLILSKDEARAAAKFKRFRGYKLSADAKALCRDFGKAPR